MVIHSVYIRVGSLCPPIFQGGVTDQVAGYTLLSDCHNHIIILIECVVNRLGIKKDLCYIRVMSETTTKQTNKPRAKYAELAERSKPKDQASLATKTKMRKVLTEVVENSSTLKAAMLKAGYSPNTAIKPTQITKTKTWQALLEETIPDNRLQEVLREGLGATRTISAVTGSQATGGTVDFIEVPDYGVRHKYLDTAYKLKGKYPTGQQEGGDQSFHVHLHQAPSLHLEAKTAKDSQTAEKASTEQRRDNKPDSGTGEQAVIEA